ncbi:hypothetical protein ACQ4PT_047154 [Festuca glaucescens]
MEPTGERKKAEGKAGDQLAGANTLVGSDRKPRRRIDREAIMGRRKPAGSPAGLLMMPPGSGGDYGEPGEGSARPKLLGDSQLGLLRGRLGVLDVESDDGADGNWDDSHGGGEEPGLWQSVGEQLGGTVDMDDDLFLELDEDEPPMEKGPRTEWKILARYRAQQRPSTHDMFAYFKGVWRLRTTIRYTKLQKNYYMIMLFSQGDFDFVIRGGPWIFNRNALPVKAVEDELQPSEMILDSVPIWVRLYNVPWGKQKKEPGMKYGNLLGKALEVDAPTSEKDMNEFLRVRVELPYDRRLQTQITTGITGHPSSFKVYKLKYERVPYYCSHCGFMGHRKFECEKKRQGIPSLDYEAYELRCIPYKKYEHRSHYIRADGHPAAQRNLSFNSFGSAESRKSFRQHDHETQSNQMSLHPSGGA